MPIPVGEPLTGWYVGIIIAALVILVVVILVASVCSLARKIGEQARAVTFALDEVRQNTLALADVTTVNGAIADINNSAVAARGVLEGLG